ncbi:MAG: POTRA domain-containing protein [Alphaproteobacteria bacterium]
MFRILTLIIFVSVSQKSFGATTAPSQIVPNVLDEIEKREIENQKNRQILPEVRELDNSKELDDPIRAKINSLVIIAPKELQTVIDFNKYKEQIVGKELSINELNQFTKIIGGEYIEKGYPLVRVTLPPQELKPKGATLFFKVIDGFIEKIDLSRVPDNQRKVTFSFLKELIKKKQLQQSFLERKLLLAGNINGLSLTSAFSPGSDEGGTILTIDAKHKYVSGSIQFNNTQSQELARQLGILSLSANSALGLG